MNLIKSHSKDSCTQFLLRLVQAEFWKCIHPKFKAISVNKLTKIIIIYGFLELYKNIQVNKTWKYLEDILFLFWDKLKVSSVNQVYQKLENKPIKAYVKSYGIVSKFLQEPLIKEQIMNQYLSLLMLK